MAKLVPVVWCVQIGSGHHLLVVDNARGSLTRAEGASRAGSAVLPVDVARLVRVPLGAVIALLLHGLPREDDGLLLEVDIITDEDGIIAKQVRSLGDLQRSVSVIDVVGLRAIFSGQCIHMSALRAGRVVDGMCVSTIICVVAIVCMVVLSTRVGSVITRAGFDVGSALGQIFVPVKPLIHEQIVGSILG